MTTRGRLLLAAPLCFFAYGIIRMVGKSDGQYGPGLDWQLGHSVYLLGLLLFAMAVLMLRRSMPAGVLRESAVVITLVGVAASMVQFTVDIVVGAMADTRSEMNTIGDPFHAIPGVDLAFYSVGPILMHVGLLALTVLLATTRELPWWSPVLVLAGTAMPAITLDLMPVGALLYLAALAPIAFPKVVRPQGGPEPSSITAP